MSVCSGSAFLLLAISCTLSLASEKYWLPDLEWQTAGNWENGKPPDTDGHVIFPLETKHAVGIPEVFNFKLSEIDLPRNGYLALSKNGKLELSDSTKSSKRIFKWAKEGRLFWVDPGNWRSISDAIPHMERLPCNYDDVVLPSSERTLSMILPITPIKVRSVRTNNTKESLTRAQWNRFKNQREFAHGTNNVNYGLYSCESCICDDYDVQGYLEEICAIEKPKCGFIPCENPMKVEGHCCWYCGARIRLSNKVSLPQARRIADVALEKYSDKVTWYTRRTWDKEVEVLIKGMKGYSRVDSEEAMYDLKKMFEDEGMEVLSTESTGAPLSDSKLAIALGTFFGAPLVVLAVLLIGFSYFGYTFSQIASTCAEAWASIREGVKPENVKKSGKPQGYARFENISEGNVEIARPSGSHSKVDDENNEDEEEASTSGGRFENPLYRSQRSSSKTVKNEGSNVLDTETPLSLNVLKDTVEGHVEEVEMNIE